MMTFGEGVLLAAEPCPKCSSPNGGPFVASYQAPCSGLGPEYEVESIVWVCDCGYSFRSVCSDATS